LEKQVKKDEEQQPMKRQCKQPIREKEEWSAGLTDG
jgi:hypothetical protein